MNCLWLQPEILHHELPPASAGGVDLYFFGLSRNQNKFPLLTALAKALRNEADFIFWLKPALAQTNLRLKPEAIHKANKAEAVRRAELPLLEFRRKFLIDLRACREI